MSYSSPLAKQRYYTDDELDDAIDAWHDGDGEGLELHEFLGWSEQEYSTWVSHPGQRPVGAP